MTDDGRRCYVCHEQTFKPVDGRQCIVFGVVFNKDVNRVPIATYPTHTLTLKL